MVMDILSLLSVLLCSTHLVWILEKNIKNWLDESQKSKSSDNPCLFAVHKSARNQRFWKAKSFYNWWIPIYDTSKCLKIMHLTISAVTFMNFVVLCSIQLVSFIEKSNFSVYGVYIWKWLKKSFQMYQMQKSVGLW